MYGKQSVSGVMPLRNAVKLGYPFEIAIRSLQHLCNEVVVLVDPTSEDDTFDRVRALAPDRLVTSTWDMSNHGGGEGRSEIARQTDVACAAATGDWIFSLQADEVLHEGERDHVREEVNRAKSENVTGILLTRLYFYGGLDRYRRDWTMPLLRLFRRGEYAPDYTCGAMSFLATKSGYGLKALEPERAAIYHYSRVGDPAAVSRRVRNLDTFYHPPEALVSEADVPPYDYAELRELDTYVRGHVSELAAGPRVALLPFPVERHPAEARRYYGV